jgi:hypothetical protein
MDHQGVEAERREREVHQPPAGRYGVPAIRRPGPCADRPRLFDILIGFSMFMTGAVLTLTLIGAPIGLPLFAAGLGLMLSDRPCPGGSG